jgi:predicted nucleic-acid-binding protein
LRITPDTNVLVRVAVNDDPEQAREARRVLHDAEVVVLTLQALCELVSVLRRAYRRPAEEIGAAIRSLIAASTVMVDRPATEAGLAMLEAGGDFADAVIAFEGRRAGGPVFISFDREATELIAASGGDAHLLG